MAKCCLAVGNNLKDYTNFFFVWGLDLYVPVDFDVFLKGSDDIATEAFIK